MPLWGLPLRTGLHSTGLGVWPPTLANPRLANTCARLFILTSTRSSACMVWDLVRWLGIHSTSSYFLLTVGSTRLRMSMSVTYLWGFVSAVLTAARLFRFTFVPGPHGWNTILPGRRFVDLGPGQ